MVTIWKFVPQTEQIAGKLNHTHLTHLHLGVEFVNLCDENRRARGLLIWIIFVNSNDRYLNFLNLTRGTCVG